MAVDTFLKFASIKGDSQDKDHKDEVEVLGWSWGAHQSGTMHRGKGGGAGKVSVNDLSITKYVDQATPNLWKLCCNGKHEDEAVLTMRKAGGDTALEYLKITLEEVLVADIQTGGSDGEESRDRIDHAELRQVQARIHPAGSRRFGRCRRSRRAGISARTWKPEFASADNDPGRTVRPDR